MRKRFIDDMVAAAERIASDPEILAETHAVQEDFAVADAEALEIAEGPGAADDETGGAGEVVTRASEPQAV